MGIEYYMYAPKDNVIYDVGKLHNWEHFKPFLTSAHPEWILLNENQFDWYPELGGDEYPKDQEIEIHIETDMCKFTHKLTIPKDVEKRNCFSDEFKRVFDDWKINEEERQEKRQEKINKWREEDERIAQQTPEEKRQIVDRVMNELYPGGDGDGS